jgi:hypothetical protein
MLRAIVMGWGLALLLSGATKPPSFQEYSCAVKLNSPPLEPQLTTAWLRKYATRIRLGAAGKEGFRRNSEYIEAAGPNFAGHYRVVNWGCGSGCLMMVVVDLETGVIYPPPMPAGATGIDRIAIANLGTGWGDFDFRADSRLFIMKTCPWGSPDVKSRLYRGPKFCGTSYFVIEAQGFRLLRRIPEELLPPPE